MAIDMMTNLANSFAGPALQDLGDRLGIPPAMVKAATPMVIGLVLSGVKRVAAQPGGIAQLSSLMTSSSDRMGGRDMDAFVKEADPAKSADLLEALTGNSSVDQVSANLARKAGLEPEAAAKMLAVMSPAVMSQLSGMAKEQGLDAQGVANLISENDGMLKGLGDFDYILDDVPGISDDIKRGFDKLFGRG